MTDSVRRLVDRSVGRSEDTFDFFTLEDAHLPEMTLDDL